MRHEGKSQKEATARALDMLEVVRIPSAKRRLDAYPHEMSGGMRQRAMIALALACKPKILLADEPTTALDATVQIQILLLLRELQREFGMSVIFVTHDIGVAIEICDRVAVMYAGRIVEQAPIDALFDDPQHPYSLGLMNAIPRLDLPDIAPRPIEGAPPDMAHPPTGCPFHPRCPNREPICAEDVPRMREVAPGHQAACHFAGIKVFQPLGAMHVPSVHR
jgi:peptide/nickel transport system ATP-binding protein